MFADIISRIQSPQTAIGKNVRDAVLFGLAAGAISILNGIDTVDFGSYDAIITAVVGFITVALNRVTRK